MSPLTPALRALAQLDDPVFLGVVARSVAWAVALFLMAGWGLAHAAHGWLGLSGWLAGAIGSVGAALLAWLLFLPVVAVVASLFADRVAARVEARFYPALPPARAAPLGAQLWDGAVLGMQLLALQAVALAVSPFVVGASLPLGLGIAAWAIARGLFVAVAMRRMPRPAALAAWRARRGSGLLQGLLVAAGGLVPLLNLLVPVLGVAAMVHVLHADDHPPGPMRRRNGGPIRVVARDPGMLGPPPSV